VEAWTCCDAGKGMWNTTYYLRSEVHCRISLLRRTRLKSVLSHGSPAGTENGRAPRLESKGKFHDAVGLQEVVSTLVGQTGVAKGRSNGGFGHLIPGILNLLGGKVVPVRDDPEVRVMQTSFLMTIGEYGI